MGRVGKIALFVTTSAVVAAVARGSDIPRVQIGFAGGAPAVSAIQRDSLQDELGFVYIGSSSCAWSNTPQVVEDVGRAMDLVADIARDRGESFATLGIARDTDPQTGFGHLAGVGDFHEINSGGQRFNVGFMRYVHRDLPGRDITPQLIVVSRRVRTTFGRESFEDERVLVRKFGADEIRSWVASGAPVPGYRR